MFTFSKGFEAASLKIPQKDLSSTLNGPYSQDQQSHVSATQWSQDDGFGPTSTNTAPPPRKQIIGFAKFKTRGEALEARDMLQEIIAPCLRFHSRKVDSSYALGLVTTKKSYRVD